MFKGENLEESRAKGQRWKIEKIRKDKKIGGLMYEVQYLKRCSRERKQEMEINHQWNKSLIFQNSKH